MNDTSILWEEKNSTEAQMKSESSQTFVQNVGINETKNEFVKKECEDTGKEKKWKRNCPKCGKILQYSRKGTLTVFNEKNSACRSCSKINFDDIGKVFSRKCPQCHKELIYCNKYVLEKQTKFNTICGSCSSKNRGLGKNTKHNRLLFGEANFNELYKHYKYSAKKRGKDFQLSKNDAKKLFESNCFYCGSEPKQIKKMKSCYGDFIYNGIDRKDNNKGYELNNVVSCCGICNRAKYKLSTEQFIQWIRTINENTKNIII